jgi:hypothetical protein
MQHYYLEYYQPENKPNFSAPPPREPLKVAPPPALQEYCTLSLAAPPIVTYWSNVPYALRSQSGYPTPYLEPVVQAISGGICLGHSSVGDPREVNVLKLHGTAYSQSLGLSPPSSNLSRPGYTIPAEGVITSGGLLWGSSPRSKPLPCNPKLVSALLKALKYNSWCEVLEFGDCFVLPASEDEILSLFAEVCRSNTTLLSLSFPPRAADASPIVPKTNKYVLYTQISDALLSNPRPLFSSFDFTNCRLGDEGVCALLPGLTRLFSRRNTLTSLKFAGNNLSARGVALICEALLGGDSSSPFFHLTELSFGGNPWCADPNAIPVQHLNTIIRISPHLERLNLEATDGVFPIQFMKFDLIGSGCPLVDLTVGGFQLPPGGVSFPPHATLT